MNAKRSVCVAGALCGLALLASGAARSQGASSMEAEALFREGKRLLGTGRYAEACPKLAESYRLDPATGALLALAICRESEGKIASAWTAYAEVAARAKAEGRSDREQAARAKLTALEPQLSTLTIVVSKESAVAGLQIERDGVEVARAAWGVPVPVDPGAHTVGASAAGRRPWSSTTTITLATRRVTVAVPELAAVVERADPRHGLAPASETAPGKTTLLARGEAPSGDRDAPWSTTQKIGVAVTTTGVVALGAAGVFVYEALQKKHAYQSELCAGTCPDYQAAVRDGNIATGLSVGGVVTLAVGLTMYLLGRGAASGGDHSIAATPLVTAGAWRLQVAGTF